MTMPIPRFFEPDPEIPDADLLGYGDIVYDDGSRRYVSNEPDVVAQLETPKFTEPPNLQQQVPVPDLGGQQPQGPPAPQPIQGTNLAVDMFDPEGKYVKEFDPLAGNSMAMPAQTPMGPMGQQPQGGGLGLDSVGTPVRPDGSTMQTPEQFDALMSQGPPAPQPIPGTNLAVDMFDPEGKYVKEFDPNALQLVGREGALPPDVQAQQLGALGQAQQATLAANEQARADTARIQQEAFAQEMGVNEARKQAEQQELQEQQAKVQRWEGERQQWAEMEVDKSLSGAQGTFGAALSVLGAALLSSTGSDAGLRMIENSINRHVQGQMQRRDSMLRIYAERIGDTQQAIKMAKSEMYKITADRAELMTKKTANDVYEAQSPAIIAGLREKQTTEMNEAQRIGLGKPIEKLPERAKPPDAGALQKYGELRRERDAASEMVQRMEQQTRLEWVPGKGGQPGHYRNKAEVIKNGIEGVGAIEQWIPDFVYSTFGQKEGYQVRGAKQALAFAVVRQMQPSGPITDVDRKVGEVAATMDTEAGLIQTLERLRNGEEQQRKNDEAQYTPRVVSEYEQQYRASGGQQMGELGAGRPAALEDKQREIQRIKQGGQQQQQPAQQPGQAGTIPEPTAMDIENASKNRAQEAGLNPDAVWKVIRSESGGKPGVTNKSTGKHAGLIQFSRETWAGLAKDMGSDVSWEDMRKMSAEEQLPFVMRYYERQGLGPDNDAGDYKLATFFPAAMQEPDDFVIGRKGSRQSIYGLSMGKIWEQNPGLRNGDTITVGDVRRSVN